MRIPDKYAPNFKALGVGSTMTIPWEAIPDKESIKETTMRDGPRELRKWEIKPTHDGVVVKRVK